MVSDTVGTEQYVQHDWSYLTWCAGLGVMVALIFAVMGLFLFMVARASNTTAPRESAAPDADAVATPVTEAPPTSALPAT